MARTSPDGQHGPPSSSSAAPSSSSLSYRTAKSLRSSPTLPIADPPQDFYRTTKPLPYELQEHCAIFFEEGLYCQALDFLTSLITASVATSTPRPALVPPPQFLRLISTLTVHPTLTTRAKSNDRLQAAILAQRYLRLVLRHTGPIQSGMPEAFKYDGAGGRPTGRRRTGSISPEKNNLNVIENDLANSAALFSQAESFWHVVGWAFNCSILHPKRWDRWQAWLEHTIEVLEVDWAIRQREDDLEQSMLVQYIIAGGGQADSGRRILRAIFADGKRTSIGEFKEIWPHETKSLKTQEDEIIKAEKAINIEADDYGDYLSDENDTDLNDSPTTTHSSSSLKTASISHPLAPFGGPIALQLRFRLVALLSQAAYTHPSCLSHATTNGIESLLSQISPYLLPHPPSTISVLLSPPTLRPLPPATASVLIQFLLHRTSLLEPAAPEPESYELTQTTLEGCYLPWAASSGNVTNNAKVSVCVETLVRLLERFGGGLVVTREFTAVVEEGVGRREERASEGVNKRGRKRKGGSGREADSNEGEEAAEAWGVLRESGRRLKDWSRDSSST